MAPFQATSDYFVSVWNENRRDHLKALFRRANRELRWAQVEVLLAGRGWKEQLPFTELLHQRFLSSTTVVAVFTTSTCDVRTEWEYLNGQWWLFRFKLGVNFIISYFTCNFRNI